MNDLKQENLLQIEAQISDELSVEDLEDISGGINLIPLIPAAIALGRLFTKPSGGSRSSSTSSSNNSSSNSGNITLHC